MATYLLRLFLAVAIVLHGQDSYNRITNHHNCIVGLVGAFTSTDRLTDTRELLGDNFPPFGNVFGHFKDPPFINTTSSMVDVSNHYNKNSSPQNNSISNRRREQNEQPTSVTTEAKHSPSVKQKSSKKISPSASDGMSTEVYKQKIADYVNTALFDVLEKETDTINFPTSSLVETSATTQAPDKVATDSVPDSPYTLFRHGLEARSEYDVGLAYLGIGTDLLFASPPMTSGDDPGYRSPVIQFDFDPQSNPKYPKPRGVYIRPYNSCRETQNSNELRSLEDWSKEFSADAYADAGFGIATFSASVEFKKLMTSLSEGVQSSWVKKSYCVTSEVGLMASESFGWKHTEAFEHYVKVLPSVWAPEKCDPSMFRENPVACRNTPQEKWEDFFSHFGTHVLVRLMMGGRIVQTYSMDSKTIERLKSTSGDISAAIRVGSLGGVSTGMSGERIANNLVDSTGVDYTLAIIGGEPILDSEKNVNLSQWATASRNHPMPIQTKYLSIMHFLPEKLHSAFASAIKFHAKVWAVPASVINDLNRYSLTSLYNFYKECQSQMWTGPPPGTMGCLNPQHFVVQGWSMKLNVSEDKSPANEFPILECPSSDLHRCNGEGIYQEPGDVTRMFTTCCPRQMPMTKVFAIHSSQPQMEYSCAHGTTIIWAVGFSFPGGNSFSEKHKERRLMTGTCTSGAKDCTLALGMTATTSSYMMGLCGDDMYQSQNLNTYSTISNPIKINTDKSKTSIACREDDEVIYFGFHMLLHEFIGTEQSAVVLCRFGDKECTMRFQLHIGSFTNRPMGAIWSFIVCGPNSTTAITKFSKTLNSDKGTIFETDV